MVMNEQELIEQYAEGWSIRRMSRWHGVQDDAVIRRLRQLQVGDRTRPGHDDVRAALVYALRASGLSWSAVAAEVARQRNEPVRTESALLSECRRYCDRQGLPRPRQRRARPAEMVTDGDRRLAEYEAGQTYRQIAWVDGVSHQAVHKSIVRARTRRDAK